MSGIFSSQILSLMGSPPINSFKSLFNNLLHPTFQPTTILSPARQIRIVKVINLTLLRLLHTPSIPSDQLGASHFFFFSSCSISFVNNMARFLKLEVLPVLAQSSEIKIVRQRCLTPVNTGYVRKGRDPGFEFVWKVVDPKEGKYWTRRDRGPKEKENIGMDTSNVVHRPHN